MKQKRLLPLLLVLCLVICLVPFGALADDDAAAPSGCGENVTWAFDEATGILTISGDGSMDGYAAGLENRPWDSLPVTEVIVEDGVLSLGDYAFSDMDSLKKVTIGGDVETIGLGVFAGCDALDSIVFTGDEAPSFVSPEYNGSFDGVTATVYYPAYNATYTDNLVAYLSGEDVTYKANLTIMPYEHMYIFVVDGEGKWVTGSVEGLELKLDVRKGRLLYAMVDGFILNPSVYTLEEDRIVLHPELLNLLPPGMHVLTLVYTDGITTIIFTVECPEEPEEPDETIPDETIPEDTTPEETTPEDTTPEDTTPEDTTPEDTTPEDTTPEETTPEDTTPEETTPEDTTPEDTTPEETTPEDTTPEDTTPEDTTPEETTPEDTTPEEPTEKPTTPASGDSDVPGLGGSSLFAPVMLLVLFSAGGLILVTILCKRFRYTGKWGK